MTGEARQSNPVNDEGNGTARAFFERARREMAELDSAIESVGSTRQPERRVDRAPAPMPTTPIYNPAVLGY